MRELIVVSGKGGTGKTSLVSAFAALVENKVMCDADVDAADLHLILAPEVKQRHDFKSGHTAVIDPDKCTACGICVDMCRFDAISLDFVVDSTMCEGCGVCHYFCPAEAVDFPINTCGQWMISNTRFGPLVHAHLGIGEENSGKLVALVRRTARDLADQNGAALILTDGPPGIGCPVIAAIGGADAVLIVTEPTVSGIHDMRRVVELADHFKVPAMVSVNKYDLNPHMTAEINLFGKQNGLDPVGNIPFDPVFTEAMVIGQSICEADPRSAGAGAVRAIWEAVREKIGT